MIYDRPYIKYGAINMGQADPRIHIGLEFRRHSFNGDKDGKIVDIYTTVNNNGEVIKVEYVCQSELWIGQIVHEILDARSVLRSI